MSSLSPDVLLPKAPCTLILGGTGGLGRALAEVHESEGRPVIRVGRESRVSSSLFLRCDLAAPAEAEFSFAALLRVLDSLVTRGLGVDRFFWVAGVNHRALPEALNLDDAFRLVDVNFRNSLAVALWAWKHLQARGEKAHFSVVSSTAGISEKPRADEAVYAATKAAQVSFTRALGKANDSSTFQVSLFCPGGMQTELWKNEVLEPGTFESFMDPRKVAQHIFTRILQQTEPFREEVIPRGSF